MRVRSVFVVDFRNQARAEVAFEPGLNVIVGPNGVGKTNLLEAVDVTATGRSHRTVRETEVIRFGAEQAVARAAYERAGGGHVAEVRLYRSGLKHIRINGARTSRAGLLGRVVRVLSGPQDSEVVAGPAGHRRRLMDGVLCQLSASHYRNLLRYARVLQQRNRLLRAGAPAQLLEVWDEQLIELGTAITDRRASLVRRLAQHASEAGAALGCGGVGLRYLPSWSGEAEGARVALLKARREEYRRGVTLTGPHRDDLEITLDGIAVRAFGSRGQQRAVVVALRLAEREVVRKEMGEDPVLLFDDVLSDLDRARAARLLEIVSSCGQAVLTATDRSAVHTAATVVVVGP
ncbi:MAG: DNA replication/repair protein RecF [Armatimonadota bacterium]|nr:DNA replication/repair protein RecF [Armatimonadota bacterium]MDR5696738.1 DNA replication/repair protein RecF [Armatimonadota bacterium]